jgi:hypothetical protein
MADTYDASLPTDLDWVRFLIYDRDPTKARIHDSEIIAALAEEQAIAGGGTGHYLKYLTAASVGQALLAKSGGVTSKHVEGLSISWGGKDYQDYLTTLRQRGIQLLLGPKHAFEVF